MSRGTIQEARTYITLGAALLATNRRGGGNTEGTVLQRRTRFGAPVSNSTSMGPTRVGYQHPRIPPLIAMWALLIGSTASAQEANAALTLQPRGAFASGTEEVYRERPPSQPEYAYHFKFTETGGGETIHYVLDMNHADFVGGMISVKEESSGAYPIREGGLAWRVTSSIASDSTFYTSFQDPHAYRQGLSQVTRFHEYLDPITKKLTLQYRETGVATSHKTYEIWLVGKVLKIRAYGNRTVNGAFVNNYDFLHPGYSVVCDPLEQHIPYMDNAVVVRYFAAATCGQPSAIPTFYGLSLDLYRSNGCSPHLPISSQSPGFLHFYPTMTLKDPSGQVLANADDTLNLIVTKDIRDTFLVPCNYRSPYYRLTSGRAMAFGWASAPGSWNAYKEQYELFKEWGLSDLAIMQWGAHKWADIFLMPDNDIAGIMGCTPETFRHFSSVDGPTGIEYVDPLDPTSGPDPTTIQDLIDEVDSEFVPLATAARETGAVFASHVVHPLQDQWGFGSPGDTCIYPCSLFCSGPCCTNGYLINPPLHMHPFWDVFPPDPVGEFGLLFPSSNPTYHHAYSVLTSQNCIAKGWDYAASLQMPPSNWPDAGYFSAAVDFAFWEASAIPQNVYGKQHYQANAVLHDASHQLPPADQIDQTLDPTKTHTLRDALSRRTKALREIRKDMGGPLYGEGNYLRSWQAYDYGARDGFRHLFPVDDTWLYTNSDSWVVPDYNLAEVMQKCAGNSGMGVESDHMSTAHPRYDCDQDPAHLPDIPDGDFDDFIDSYITTTATYGNNACFSTNGHRSNTHWSYQGILRQYAMLSGLSRRMREGGVPEVMYYDPSHPTAPALSLAEVLRGSATEVDCRLKYPLIKITFENGLVFYANHSGGGSSCGPRIVWESVVVPKHTPTGGSEVLDIAPNGFAAGDGSELFEFYNAKPHGSQEYFDYVDVRDRIKMINNRRWSGDGCSDQYEGNQYDQFPDASMLDAAFPDWCDQGLFEGGLVMKDYVQNVVVGAAGGLWDLLANPPDWTGGKVVAGTDAPAPCITSVSIETDADVLYTGKPEGLTLRATYSNGAWKDVTTLAQWQIDDGAATVDQSGAVTALVPDSSVTIMALFSGNFCDPLGLVPSITLPTSEGRPSAVAGPDKTVFPGAAVTFDASASEDPKGGTLGYRWVFGDGSGAEGRVVTHVYSKSQSAPYVATLTTEDVEENTRTDTVQVTTSAPGAILWADSFDDGTWVPRWIYGGTGLWGIVSGAARQLISTTPTTGMLTAGGPGQTLPIQSTASVGTEVRLYAPLAAGRYAGLHARKLNPGDLPTASGYITFLDGNSRLTLKENGAGGLFVRITPQPVPSLSVAHDVRLISKPAQAPATGDDLRVYVDGLRQITANDPTPRPSGHTGIFTQDQQAAFDDFRVTNWQAPYITAVPMELKALPPTLLSFFIDDQDGIGDFNYPLNPNPVQLVIRNEDDPTASPLVYNGWAALPPHTTTVDAPTDGAIPTWVKITLSNSVETFMSTTYWPTNINTISFELTISDNAGRRGRKFVRFSK